MPAAMTDVASMPVHVATHAPSPAGAGEPTPPSMRAQSLDAYFGDTHAVRGVTLAFPANEVTAIIGPSGCGKSTFLRCLNRMHETNPVARVEGHVYFHDADIYADGVDPITLNKKEK